MGGGTPVGEPPTLSQLLTGDPIRIGSRAPDWRAAVRACGEALIESGATTADYTDEMIATVEQLGPSIVIAPGIALAHSRPSPSVLRAGMSLVILAAPVAFGHRQNDPVQLVIGLAAPDDEAHITALATLTEFLSDDERRTTLMGARDAWAIRRMIDDYEGGLAR